MTTEATTSGRARSADGRFASKATVAADVATTADAIPASVPDTKKADAKKKAKSKPGGKKKK
ncbi:MAG TPA: hypothetical protein VFD20_04205 [Demequina sp.]|nr:hypothetical protein [Demequina sp.]